MLDAVVVGSGPNGLAAAITLARAGKQVRVIEGSNTVGGGARSDELTEPGVLHDVCSAAHPLGAGSPFLATLPLDEHGLDWVHPRIPFGHALEDGSVLVHRSLEETVAGLGADGATWRRVFGPFVTDWERTVRLSTAPPLCAVRSPMAGLRLARFALRSGQRLAQRFSTDEAKALIAGLSAHSTAPLSNAATGGVALLLGTAAHAVGWPFARGGSGAITRAMASYFESLGGEIETGRWVRRMADVPDTRVLLLSTSADAAASIAGEHISASRRKRYRSVAPGPGTFKLDIATSGPIPWADPRLAEAGTVHLGGTYAEIAAAEEDIASGTHPSRPFVLLTQPLVADRARAPAGTGVVWAYAHAPTGSTEDMTDQILDQIERFAPGFRTTIRTIASKDSAGFEEYNPNFRDGDITGGAVTLSGILQRPTVLRPYRAGPGVYLCSSATPPGAGVHGMCGHHAARAALKEL